MIGIVSIEEALSIAKEKEVDLVEISPKADPPVCKVIDYGKMIYAQKKREQKAKKLNKASEVKGVRLTFRIGPGDLERQQKTAKDFLEKGHPIRIQLIMKGREKTHKDLAYDKLNKFINSLKEVGTLDQPPRAAGHQIIAMMRPGQGEK